MKIRALQKTYENRLVLDTEAFDLEPGRIHVLIGANGCGKSTLARILAGIEPPDHGGETLPRDLRVTYVPQKPYAFRMSLEKNLRIVAKDPERENYLIDQLGLEELRGKHTEKFSGGETARMALARSMMRVSDLFILDEVTAAMDMESTKAAEQVILDYRNRIGCAVLMITHNIQQALRMGDTLLFMKNGKIMESGPCRETAASPKTPELQAFLDFYG